jgi:gamma-butyrobetaine dioxygenase
MNVMTPSPDTATEVPSINAASSAQTVHNRAVASAIQIHPAHLQLRWPDGHTSTLALDWLRDNCPCGLCRHSNGQKLFNINDLPEALSLAEATLEGERLALTWSDLHQSTIDLAWLASHDLSPVARSLRLQADQTTVLWDRELGQTYARADWSALCNDTSTEQHWLDGFLKYGFGLIQGVPHTEGAVCTVGEKLGHVRVTNYGRWFDVRSVPDPNNLADTALGLSVHSDNPYRHPSPGVQLLHCLIAEAPGGDTQLVDGFAVAQLLRQQDPSAFELLCTWPMQFRYRNADAELHASQTLISVDANQRITAVHFNNRSSFFLDVPEELAGPWYKAYRAFAKLLSQPRQELVLRLSPGDCIVMQNDRTLHGRTAFDPNLGQRLLQGCYIDIDAMRSRLSVLRRNGLGSGNQPRIAV